MPAGLILRQYALRAKIEAELIRQVALVTRSELEAVYQGKATLPSVGKVYRAIMSLDLSRGGACEISSTEAESLGVALGLAPETIAAAVSGRKRAEAQRKEKALLAIGRELASLRGEDLDQYRWALRDLGMSRDAGRRAIERWNRVNAGDLVPEAFEKRCACGNLYIDAGGPARLRMCGTCLREDAGEQEQGRLGVVYG